MKLIDLTGQRFGRLTVVEKDKNKKTSTGSYWICQCDCGNIKSVRSAHLRKGKIVSCGCFNKEKMTLYKADDLTNQRFGMLTAIKRSERQDSDGRIYWDCICDCGNHVRVIAKDLKSGHTGSCGCKHQSFGEKEIEELLKSNSIRYQSQYRFNDFKQRIYDFALLDYENKVLRLIEFDGEQHFKSVEHWEDLKNVQSRDKEKNQYALLHNIPLIRIPYWERGKISLDLIFGDKYLVRKE